MKNRNKMFFIIITITLLLPVYAIGCQNDPGKTSQPEPYFPVQKDMTPDLELPIRGELVLEDTGCLRISGNLIIWPYGCSLTIEGGEIWVVNDRGWPSIRVGDFVQLSGGAIPDWFAEEKIGHALPEQCKGPCFLAGKIMTPESDIPIP